MKESDKAKNVSPSLFKKVLSKVGFPSKPTSYSVDTSVIENIEEFVRNNNIFEKIDRVSLKFF